MWPWLFGTERVAAFFVRFIPQAVKKAFLVHWHFPTRKQTQNNQHVGSIPGFFQRVAGFMTLLDSVPLSPQENFKHNKTHTNVALGGSGVCSGTIGFCGCCGVLCDCLSDVLVSSVLCGFLCVHGLARFGATALLRQRPSVYGLRCARCSCLLPSACGPLKSRLSASGPKSRPNACN